MADLTPDMFLKLEGIQGESTDSAHKNEIDVISFKWVTTQGGSAQLGSGTGAGKAQMNDLVITKHVDRASPVLMAKHLSGATIATAVLTLRKAGGTPLDYAMLTMSNCVVTQISHGAGNAGHTEDVSLQFSAIQYDYKMQQADGTGGPTISAGYNASTNKVT